MEDEMSNSDATAAVKSVEPDEPQFGFAQRFHVHKLGWVDLLLVLRAEGCHVIAQTPERRLWSYAQSLESGREEAIFLAIKESQPPELEISRESIMTWITTQMDMWPTLRSDWERVELSPEMKAYIQRFG
jgi:hypothetical protein